MPLPTKGRITQVFGPTDEKLDSGGINKGIDISAVSGSPVIAVVPGTVISAGDSNDGWGTSVKIRDANGNIHNYGHLSAANVRVGQSITVGQNIGDVGSTGASTGPHLSYDVKGVDGQYIDPSTFVGEEPGTYAGDNRTGVSTPQTAHSGSIREKLDELEDNIPPEGTAEWEQWAESLDYYQNAYANSIALGDDPNERAQQEFDNELARTTRSLSYDTINLDKASLEIDRFLSGLQESRGRAGLIADAQRSAIDYGTSNGKTDFSPSDLGSAFESMAGTLGLDPNAPLLSYSGTTTLNPRQDMADYDRQFGVTGQIPGTPSLVTQPGDIPSIPPWQLPQQQANPNATSIFGTMNQPGPPGTQYPETPRPDSRFGVPFTDRLDYSILHPDPWQTANRPSTPEWQRPANGNSPSGNPQLPPWQIPSWPGSQASPNSLVR